MSLTEEESLDSPHCLDGEDQCVSDESANEDQGADSDSGSNGVKSDCSSGSDSAAPDVIIDHATDYCQEVDYCVVVLAFIVTSNTSLASLVLLLYVYVVL